MKTYKEWLRLLNQLVEYPFDERYIEEAKTSHFELTPLLAGKFMKQYTTMLNELFKVGATRFEEEYRRSAHDEATIVRTLMAQKKRHRQLLVLCNLPFFEEDLKKQLCSMIQGAADEMQQSLERSSQEQRHDYLHHILKTNAVNRLEETNVTNDHLAFKKRKGRNLLL